jgi:[histone H3]-trimethyl-L-lysine4 demethylase
MMNSSSQLRYTIPQLRLPDGIPISNLTDFRLTSAMDIMVDRELRSREETRRLFPDIEETIIEEDFPSDEYYQCSVCKTYIYLSQITCPCTTNAVCPSHASELCDCEVDTRVLRLRYTDQDLIDLATKISDRAKIPEVWSQKFNAVMSEYERPPLRLLRSLLSEADRIPYPLPELSTLKAFVERANEWVEEATSFVSRKHQNRRKNERVWRSGSRVQELEERDRAQRSSEYVYKLLDQAEELGFDAAEIELLRAKAEAIEEFQERAKMALDEGSANTLEEYTELIDVGKSLNVDLPALDTLERIVDQLKWIEKATDTTDLYLSLEEVLMVMEDGERCGISLDHELMKQLAARRNKGQVWENCASTLLASENLSLRDLEILLDDATDLSIHKETYDKVESIVIRTKEATQHVKTLRNRITPSVAQNPTFAEARRALKVLEELPAKGTDFTTFKRIVAVTEEWVKRGKRLFGKTNASVNQLEDHLAFVLQRNEHVFDPLDVPNREDESPGAMENKDSEDGPYCICRSGPTGEMVECDKCKEWY